VVDADEHYPEIATFSEWMRVRRSVGRLVSHDGTLAFTRADVSHFVGCVLPFTLFECQVAVEQVGHGVVRVRLTLQTADGDAFADGCDIDGLAPDDAANLWVDCALQRVMQQV
jgi:hypothetical protein